jgi:hypothetical protein
MRVIRPTCPLATCGQPMTRMASAAEIGAAGIDPAWLSIYHCNACSLIWIELVGEQVQPVGFVSSDGRVFEPIAEPVGLSRGKMANANPKRFIFRT